MSEPNMFPKFNLLKAVCMCVTKGKNRKGGGWRGEKRLRRGQNGKGGVRQETGDEGTETFMAVRKEELPTG